MIMILINEVKIERRNDQYIYSDTKKTEKGILYVYMCMYMYMYII